jgi:hypothetical protein
MNLSHSLDATNYNDKTNESQAWYEPSYSSNLIIYYYAQISLQDVHI